MTKSGAIIGTVVHVALATFVSSVVLSIVVPLAIDGGSHQTDPETGQLPDRGSAWIGVCVWAPSVLLGVLWGVYVRQYGQRREANGVTDVAEEERANSGALRQKETGAGKGARGPSWWRRDPAGAAGLTIVLLTNVFFVWMVADMTCARWMPQARECRGVAGTALLVGVPLGVLSLWRGPRKWVGAVVLVLALTPYVVLVAFF